MAGGGPAFGAYRTEIGYDDLVNDYAGTLPNGAGVQVSMVESEQQNINSKYMPKVDASPLTQTTIINGSSSQFPTTMESTHATGMAYRFFGTNLSVASGIPQATVYEVDHFLNNVLNLTAQQKTTPDTPTYQIQNHSWAGSFDQAEDIRQALGRVDYLVNEFDLISPVGINNSPSELGYLELLAQGYNVIAVGRTDGFHFSGPTTLSSYGPGRMRPDIVGPELSTSGNTAAVSSVAAMLYQSATDTQNFPNADPDAAKSETMKAILMAGATKQEFPGWENASPTQPLDTVYGAGELNVYNSFFVQQGGQFDGQAASGGPQMGDYGWDYADLNTGESLFYELEVPEFYTAGELSVVLAWNANITDGNSGTAFNPVLNVANLDLRLFDEQGLIADSPLVTSVSTVDNVEHIYLSDTPVGKYTLEVRYESTGGINPPASQDFGIAWRLDSQAPYRVTGDYNEDGFVDSADYTLWRDSFGSDTDLSADGNLNGIVDQGDYTVWRNAFGSTHTPPEATISSLIVQSTPEPGAAWLLLSLLGGRFLCRRR